jgi:hypothetical protein
MSDCQLMADMRNNGQNWITRNVRDRGESKLNHRVPTFQLSMRAERRERDDVRHGHSENLNTADKRGVVCRKVISQIASPNLSRGP